MKKNGKVNGVQRFLCMKCNKTFGINMIKPQNELKKFINLYTKNIYDLDKICNKLTVSKRQLYYWIKMLDMVTKTIPLKNKYKFNKKIKAKAGILIQIVLQFRV